MKTFTPTEAFDVYWHFATERQKIFHLRAAGTSSPWTDDPILQTYKFTCPYRAADRVSQYLIRNVIYSEQMPNSTDDSFLRIILFKLFNKISTWELILKEFGIPSASTFNISHYDELLSEMIESGQRIFSAAYIMPSGIKDPGFPKKHQNCLTLLSRMLDDNLPAKISASGSMEEAFLLLRGYPMIGNFLAYQFTIDINYSEITNFDENDFVMPGPGAVRGINKCCNLDTKGNEKDVISWMTQHQDDEFERLGLDFKKLWGRKLHLIDCQNIFCEVDKYLRVFRPSIKKNNAQKRIKQKYTQTLQPIDYFFPPKWGIKKLP